MEQFELIRRMHFVDGLSIREIARTLKHSRKSVRKAIENSTPPNYQTSAKTVRPKLDPFMPLIRQWLTDDLTQPRKQRHTAVRIWERLTAEYQYTGGRRGVSDAVKIIRREFTLPEILVPIDHPCGEEFQIDWGEVTISLNNQTTKVMIFCVRSAYSKASFVRAYERDDMASFMDAHVWLFEALGGVPKRLAYDNLSTAVVSVGKGKADIREGGGEASCTITHDYVRMPPLQSFRSAEAHAATLAHEMTHWTRHPSRLDRDFGRKRFGDEGYAVEELVAELGSAFLCADLGITPELREDHAAYIANWLTVLKNDKRAIFTAASHASKAVDFLHGLQPKTE